MIQLQLTDEERQVLDEALDDPAINERVKLRLIAVRMHLVKVPHACIAKALNVSDDTITNYLKRVQEDGILGLIENRHYQPTSQVEPFLDQLRDSFAKSPVGTAKEGAQRILELTQVSLSESQARRIMNRLGLKFRKSAAIPGKADPQLQLDFLATELLPRLEEAQQGQRRVFFVDAAHFVLGAFLGMIWCFQRLYIPTAAGRSRYSVLGAVETRDHDLVTIQTKGSVNAQTVCELMQKIQEQYSGETITLVMDNARYQYNGAVQQLATDLGIELLYLPAYSPNLNLIERLWRLVKSKCLRNRYYEDFAKFRTAIDQYLDSLQGENRHLLVSLLSERFHIPEIPENQRLA